MGYQPPERALAKLEQVVKLTPDQEAQALQIFGNLKEIMDDMTPEERPEKGAQSRQDAVAAIRSILTPEQQAIYDKTPQRLGGGSHLADSPMAALRLKIRTFVADFAKSSPQVAAQVGGVRSAVAILGHDSTSKTTSNADDPDPMLHPDSGTNQVKVFGKSGSEVIKVYWEMNDAGVMTVSKFEKVSS